MSMKSKKHLVVREGFDRIGNGHNRNLKQHLNENEVNQLIDYLKHLNIDANSLRWDKDSFMFVNYVGYIACATFSIEILPKVCDLEENFTHNKRSLITMLNECLDLDILVDDIAEISTMDASLLEIFARIYAESLLVELHRGPILKYQMVEENLFTLKGSLVMPEHIRQNLSTNRRYRAYCQFEERILDNDVNQVFRTANAFLSQAITNFETQKMINQIDYILDDVSTCVYTANSLEKVTLDRTNERYSKPLLLAKQFISNQTSDLSHSTDDLAFTMLFKINDLFEEYIAKLMKQLNLHQPVYSQHKGYFLLQKKEAGRGIYPLRPDIVLGENQEIIIDTKWKNLKEENRSGVKRDDLFQMTAYLNTYSNSKVAILLYPRGMAKGKYNEDNESIESWILFNKPNKKLAVHSIDLVDVENKRDKQKTINELKNILRLYLDDLVD